MSYFPLSIHFDKHPTTPTFFHPRIQRLFEPSCLSIRRIIPIAPICFEVPSLSFIKIWFTKTSELHFYTSFTWISSQEDKILIHESKILIEISIRRSQMPMVHQ